MGEEITPVTLLLCFDEIRSREGEMGASGGIEPAARSKGPARRLFSGKKKRVTPVSIKGKKIVRGRGGSGD